jgi:GNAT superfamily N-acetyltransferase
MIRMNGAEHFIRLATPEGVVFLPEIERQAGLLFKNHPEDLGIPETMYDQPNSLETFAAAQRAGHLWVAATDPGEVIGFALVAVIDGDAHLDELDVLPSHGRQGIGSALLGAVCRWATDAGYPAVSLRTFRDVPWNRAFYERRGFYTVASASLPAGLRRLEALEQEKGLRTYNRITMLRTAPPNPAMEASAVGDIE